MKTRLVVGLVLAAPTAAHAFSELDRFAEPAVDGGGGGRYFTGAPTDGLSCVVCHDDTAPPVVTVRGLPDRIEAGASYDLTLTWPDDDRKYSLALEFVNADGAPPALVLPPKADQPPEMLCQGARAGNSAAQVKSVGDRRIIYVEPCGAHTLQLTFTPPTDEDLFLGAAVVAADGYETSDGDGTYELRKKLTSSAAATTGCAAGGADGGAATAGLVGLALVASRRRRRTSR